MSKIYPNKPFLLILYGFPGSGKTYFARQLSESVQAAHLQADKVRAELFDPPRYDKQETEVVMQLMDYMTEEFLSAGLSVIYDTNANRGAQRNYLRDLAFKYHATPLVVWFQLDPETSYARSVKRDRRRADDKYSAQWDRSTYESLLSQMQNPSTSENYAVVSGKHLFNMQQSVVMRKLRDMGALSLDEAGPKIIKPGLVNLIPNQGRVDMTRRNISVRP